MVEYNLFAVVDTKRVRNRYLCGIIRGKISNVPKINTFFFTEYKPVRLNDMKDINKFVKIKDYLKNDNLTKSIKQILKYDRIWIETNKSSAWYVRHGLNTKGIKK